MTARARMLVALLAALLCWAAAAPGASAHALDPGLLDLRALGQDRWRATWRAPDVNGAAMPIAARLPESCAPRLPGTAAFDGRAWTSSWIAACPGGLAGGRIAIDGLEATRTDVLVRYETAPGEATVRRLTADAPAFDVPAEAGVVGVLTSYAGLGVTHILEGIDHLLFVLALLLLIPGQGRLVGAITAFTVAHSLTLGAATLGWLRVPSPPVEAVIALSIVFLAWELTLPPARRDPLTLRAPWLVSFAFGLVHGLGFAGALREIGLPEGDIPLALFAFNLGVEAGQLIFIAAALALLAAARALAPGLRRRSRDATTLAGYGIGTVAAFWVIERLAAF